jgi:two-component system chemotaxis sensor kinase CheA
MTSGSETNELFTEEARQLIESLEAAALELESSPTDPELIAESFRFLHTLKGAAAMYGFDRASEVAHEVESVFDSIRRQKAPVPPEVVQMSLQACDVLAQLITPAALVPDAFAAEILALRSLIAELSEEDLAAGPVIGRSRREGNVGVSATYLVRLHPSPDLFVRGVDLAAVIAEVTALGESAVHLDTEAVPVVDDLDPEECRIGATIDVRTDAGVAAIEAALIFLGPDEYTIEMARADDTVGQAGAAAAFRRGATTELEGRSVRVSSSKLDVLVDLVGEVVTAQAALAGFVTDEMDPRLLAVSETLERLTRGLRESVLDMRMVPIGTTFSRFRRHVRDLATELDKQVVLVAEGGDTQLDKSMIERIEEPLVHVIRNALDHGIEPPAARRAVGKPAQGTITLSAYQQSGHVFVRVADDGAGLDMVALERKARELELLKPDETLTPEKTAELICTPGFTTSSRVTSVSGRGVGLDVVKRTVESLQGSIDVRSELGSGTSVTIRLPLTLAIVDGLLVSVGAERYVLPLASVDECVDVIEDREWKRHGRRLVRVRDEVLPFVRLRDFFGVPGQPEGDELALVVAIDGNRVCFVVDWVIDRVQAVIKTLGRALRNADGVSGATVLGDGSIALVVDMGHVLKGIQVDAEDVQAARMEDETQDASGRRN